MLLNEQDTATKPVNGFAKRPVIGLRNTAGASFKHALAKWLSAIKEDRPDAFHGHAGELAWDLLLNLYLREAAGKPTSVSSAGIGSPMPPTTALRHINFLCETDWLRRKADESDKRRYWLTLTPQAHATIDEFLAKRCDELSSLALTHIEDILTPLKVDIFSMLERAQKLGMEAKHMIEVMR